MGITVKGFGNSHIKVGVLLFMYGWVMTVSNFGVQIFSSDLDVVRNVPSERFNISFEKTLNRQQYGNKNDLHRTEVRYKGD